MCRFPALAHRRDDARDLLLRRAHPQSHFFRRAGALFGELPNLARHNAETESVLAGARRLDRGVERQQIGLAGDARDAVDQLADLARLAIELRRHLGGMIHVHQQVHQQRAGAGDFFAAPACLRGDVGDLSLGLLRPGVQRRRESRRSLRVFAAVADQLALALGALRELIGRRADLLRRGLERSSRGRELLRHRRERLPLLPDLAHNVGNGGGRAVYADAEVADLVGSRTGRRRGELPRQVAAFDFAQHAARVAEPFDD